MVKSCFNRLKGLKTGIADTDKNWRIRNLRI